MNPLVQKFQDHLQLVNSIQETEKGNWGVMSAQNMVEHLGGLIFATAIGKGMGKLIVPADQAAKTKARFFGAYYPFPRNVKMPGTQDQPTQAPPLRFASYEEAKEKLSKAVNNFIAAYQAKPEQTALHGYFGDLSMEEWLQFHIKHIEHHLMQFSALPQADEKIPQLEKLLYKLATKIDRDTPAKWGKMNAHQMVEHIGLVFLLSTGKFDLPYKGTEEEAQKYWTAFQNSPNPWQAVFPQVSFGEPRPPRGETIAISKVGLQKTFQKYLSFCEEHADSIQPHFFLGNLTVDQWRQVHVKHLEHHLRQFGVLEEVSA